MKTTFLHITATRLAICAVVLITGFTLSGCIYDSDNLSSKCLVPVRVALHIDENKQANSVTRAGETEEKKYGESEQSGKADECYVGTLRILAFDTGGTLRYNHLFSRTATDPKDKFDFSLMESKLTADFMLPPGDYNFRAVTNEEAEWGLSSLTVGTSTLTAYETLTTTQALTNTILNETGLHTLVAANKGIPMLGEHQFTVPDQPSSAVNPIVLSAIPLKRVIAKLEVHITNEDPYNANAVYPASQLYQIKSVSVKGINQQYNLMEGPSAVTETNPLGGFTNDITHTRGELFRKALVLHTYMAERKSVSSETEATTVEVVVNKTGTGDITYTIPIYQTEDHTISGVKNYNINRNYLYRVYCYLVGSDMYVEIFYSNTDWNLITKEIFMGYGYNVEITEDGKITVSNTITACAPHEVWLEPHGGATINGSTNKVEFKQLQEDDSAVYTLEKVPASGEYLKIYYNGILVKTYTK